MSAFADPEAFLRGEETTCSSSNIASGWYEGEGQRLFLVYKDGSRYQYIGVSWPDAVAFAYAASAGKARWQILGDPRWPGGPKYPYIPG